MATSNGTWKAFERRVAKDFGAVRVGAMHPNEQRESCDCISDVHFIECKLRKDWPTPAQVREWWEKAYKRCGDAFLQGQPLRATLLCIQHKGHRGYWIVREIPNKRGLFWQHSSEYHAAE